MILRDHDIEIRATDPYRHKFADAMSEYLHQLSLDSGWDDASGNVDAPTGWFARFGKRILHEDSQGFVWQALHDTECDAIAHYDALSDAYNRWDTDE